MTSLDAKIFTIFTFLIFTVFLQQVYSQYYDYRDADRLFGEKKYEEAGKLYRQLGENNPYNGYFWDNYGYCLYLTKDYKNAIDAFKQTIETGYRVSNSMYNIACCYSLMNEPEKSVEWLKKAAEFKFANLENAVANDKDFDNIRNTEAFRKEIMPEKNQFISRIEGWKTDLEFMKKRMEQTHYDLFANISEKKWDEMFEKLSSRIDELDDAEMFIEMLKITASVGDAHTTIFPGANSDIKVYTLPLQFFMFEEGLYITYAAPEYKELAGKKVLKIGNKTPAEILTKLREVVSLDNDIWLLAAGVNYLTYTTVLNGLGIIPKTDEAELTLEGSGIVNVKSITGGRMHGERQNWVNSLEGIEKPLYLKDRNNLYWYEYLPEQKLVYMQFNGVQNKEDESVAAFSKRVFEFINNNDVNYFVLDIRFNGGGNNFLNRALVQQIIKCDKINQNGHFFTITGRNTFSAAMTLSNDLDGKTNTIFAGEPTGSKPNFTGESNMIILPYSGLAISCSSRRWQAVVSDDYRKWIAPLLGVKYYYSDYTRGDDPAMDAILNFINNK